MQKRQDLVSQTVALMDKQLYNLFSDKPLSTRIQQLIHQQFLKIQHPAQALEDVQEDERQQLEMSDYTVDKDKFVPSQSLLNKFQELYPFSVNQVEKVIPEIVQPLFNQPKVYATSNPFLGLTNSNNDSLVKPWVVLKKQLRVDEFYNNQSLNNIQINIVQEPQNLQTQTVQYNQSYKQIETFYNKEGGLKLQKVLKIQSNEKTGLDYWKKKREDMMKNIK